jgi:hypothetical protein
MVAVAISARRLLRQAGTDDAQLHEAGCAQAQDCVDDVWVHHSNPLTVPAAETPVEAATYVTETTAEMSNVTETTMVETAMGTVPIWVA